MLRRQLALVPKLGAHIDPIMAMAAELEHGPVRRPRAGYLCRLYACDLADQLDPNYSGHGVMQFVTSLHQLCKNENDATLANRLEDTDAKEMEACFRMAVQNFENLLFSGGNRERFQRAYQKADILYDVLCHINDLEEGEKVDMEKLLQSIHYYERHRKTFYQPFNILSLDKTKVSRCAAPIKDSVTALSNIVGLRWPPQFEPERQLRGELDLMDWLGAIFGFQRDSIRNQREHLVLLLSNLQMRLEPAGSAHNQLDEAIEILLGKTLQNYKQWCKFLSQDYTIRDPVDGPEILQQRNLLHISLYLLIWGEAANIRFMPECLCYIFHNMRKEMRKFLEGNDSEVRDEAFLMDVITPIYQVIKEEASKSKHGKAPYSAWCNYDDLNEYFWTSHCFSLGWPMHLDHDFFKAVHHLRILETAGSLSTTVSNKTRGKTNFVETRTFWHIYRSFYRMWVLYILALQALLIIAWSNCSGAQVPMMDLCYHLLGVFVTSAALDLIQATLDLALNYPGYHHNSKFSHTLRKTLKIVVSAVWVAFLAPLYISTVSNMEILVNWFPQFESGRVIYVLAVLAYLVLNNLSETIGHFLNFSQWTERNQQNWIGILCRWSSKEQVYVGREMVGTKSTMLKYTLFWSMLLTAKFLFSYFFQIKLMMEATMGILATHHGQISVISIFILWASIFLVYLMDTQIWYAIFSALCGGISGAVAGIGEIHTMEMLRLRFKSLPEALNTTLMPSDISRNNQMLQQFACLWNEIICSFREEDLISNKEHTLLIMPYFRHPSLNSMQWPLFLLANKVAMALDIAVQSPSYPDLCKIMNSDDYMKDAVQECYDLFKLVLGHLVIGEHEKSILHIIFNEVEFMISQSGLLQNFRMSVLPILHKKCVELVSLLKERDVSKFDNVVLILQDIVENATKDLIVNSRFREELARMGHGNRDSSQRKKLFTGTYSTRAIDFPPKNSGQFEEQVERLYTLLSMNQSSMDVPKNNEARRRITFFTNSLLMKMPSTPQISKMLSFSVLTPYYSEETVYARDDISLQNEDGVSVLFYLQRIFPDEWNNFLERINCKTESDILGSEDNAQHLRQWVSLRGQTLYRTARGMMYYKRALKLQALLEESENLEGYATILNAEEERDINSPSFSQPRAIVDLKFTYVIACQLYGDHKLKGNPRAVDILNLMISNPSIRVAYIDEVELTDSNKVQKVFYSVLVKACGNHDQEIYRIKLPGPAKIGEGKPENQNHAIIFTRGEALQAIDMNQDNYLEEAFKIRNLLEEFNQSHDGCAPTILGVREHIFTGSVSSLAWFMSNQESSFVTIGQRVLADPLKVRFHYGHPDVFDRIFHITRGGISKASCGINLSEDIFAGFNSTLRCGSITHHEYIQVGKGRDVGLNQISLFEAKVACGNGEQVLSRDIYRLGHHFGFFRMVSCYYTTVGFFVNSMMVVLIVYVFLYGRVYLALHDLETAIMSPARATGSYAIQKVMESQSVWQLGILMSAPMLAEIALERGFISAMVEFGIMQLQLCSVFFTFSLGTKAHYFGRTLLHGGAKYRATGRGFVVQHAKFVENYGMYSRSHFVKAFEMMLLLVVYNIYTDVAPDSTSYMLMTHAMWFLVITWLFAPFIFNPSGFEWQKTYDDWVEWNQWIFARGGIGVPAEKAWESWWEEEQSHLDFTGLSGRLMEMLMSCRFLIVQHGILTKLGGNKHPLVYAAFWMITAASVMIILVLSWFRKKYAVKTHNKFRLIQLLIFVTCIGGLWLTFRFLHLTRGDMFPFFLAFASTGWVILQISQAMKPLVQALGMWGLVQDLARGYEYVMGSFIFIPVGALSWFPCVSEFQNRVLFSQAFSRGLQASRFLAGMKKHS